MAARKKSVKRTTPALRRHRMEGLEQVRALSHPLRLKLVELFATQPMTTKQAADAMHEAPTRLYHHVAALERAGLIRLRETRPNRGTTEKYFEAVANRFEAGAGAVGAGRKDVASDHVALGMMLFDEARNELVRALGSESRDAADPIVAARGVFRLSPAAARRLAKDLQDLLAKFRVRHPRTADSSATAGHRRYAVTIALIPTEDASRP